MSDYPTTITADMLPKWAHISDDEIKRDIFDTQMEIKTRLKLNWDVEECDDRVEFTRFLMRLLIARKQQAKED